MSGCGSHYMNDTHMTEELSTTTKASLVKTGLRLEYLTVGWNVAESAIAIWAGVVAGSVALVGFGFDSVIEVTAGGFLIWRLRKHGIDTEEAEDRAERIALLVVGVTFFLLSAYILYQSVSTLLGVGEPPEESLVGIGLAVVSLVIMPFLGLYKKRIGIKIGSKALQADALETLVCAYLSLILLVGLGLNALFGWWWADPIAALVMLPLLLKEGREAVKEGLE